MLPLNIDLTEHSDFSHVTTLDFSQLMDTPVDLEYDEQDVMTNDDYDRIVQWENIFGKRRRPSIKRILFPKLGYDVPNLPRIPWNNIWSPYNPFREDDRIPWSSNMGESHDDMGYNLFNSK